MGSLMHTQRGVRHRQVCTGADLEGHKKNCPSPCPTRGSNPGSLDLKSDALTTELRPQDGSCGRNFGGADRTWRWLQASSGRRDSKVEHDQKKKKKLKKKQNRTNILQHCRLPYRTSSSAGKKEGNMFSASQPLGLLKSTQHVNNLFGTVLGVRGDASQIQSEKTMAQVKSLDPINYWEQTKIHKRPRDYLWDSWSNKETIYCTY